MISRWQQTAPGMQGPVDRSMSSLKTNDFFLYIASRRGVLSAHGALICGCCFDTPLRGDRDFAAKVIPPRGVLSYRAFCARFTMMKSTTKWFAFLPESWENSKNCLLRYSPLWNHLKKVIHDRISRSTKTPGVFVGRIDQTLRSCRFIWDIVRSAVPTLYSWCPCGSYVEQCTLCT